MASSQPETLLVSETFYSIQGESSLAGYPCVFIRLAGCNLRCSYCDAKYSYEEKGQPTPVATLLEFCQKYPAAMVLVTGGEPLLQNGVYELINQLLDDNRLVMLETNGSISLKKVASGVIKVMDIKCPGSGMAEEMQLRNLELLSPRDELKFVLTSRDDYQWAVDFLKTHVLFCEMQGEQARRPQILFSPVTSSLAPAELAQWLLTDQLPVRLQLQLHTILWPQKSRGV